MEQCSSTNLPYPPLEILGGLASLEQRISQLEKSQHCEREGVLSDSGESGPIDVHEPHEHTPVEVHVDHYRRAQPDNSLLSDGISGISPAVGLLGALASSEAENAAHELSSASGNPHEPIGNSTMSQTPSESLILDPNSEKALFRIYRDNVQTRYPFLCLETVKRVNQRGNDLATAYFANMIAAVGLLVRKPDEVRLPQAYHQTFYRTAITRYLPHVFAKPDPIAHIQAYLLLAMRKQLLEFIFTLLAMFRVIETKR